VDGARHGELPMTQTEFHHATPIYQHFDGWREDLSEVRDFAGLPRNAQAYVRAVEDAIGAPVAAIGTGPRRDQTLQLRPLI
jgi:adenylosuccinate synthase